ncbi:MAG TPA: polysaccharide biosynthesis/export family protein [Gemmatimonadaceae bacterium]
MKLAMSRFIPPPIVRAASAISLCAVVWAGSAAGQSPIGEVRRQATRAELEMAAKAAEAASAQAPDDKTRAKLQADAAAIRQRLTNGDFLPGDRILLLVHGDSARSDTFTVRIDRRLPLPEMDDVSLQGVLDSELEAHLRKELSRYIKPLPPATQLVVTATPLIRLMVQGAIPSPNFYTVPVDKAITDLITEAGGTGGAQAAFDKTVVRRAGEVVMDHRAFADAVRQGKTVGDMALRDGDEVFIPDKASSTFNWQTPMAVVSTLSGLYFLIRWGFGGGRRNVP